MWTSSFDPMSAHGKALKVCCMPCATPYRYICLGITSISTVEAQKRKICKYFPRLDYDTLLFAHWKPLLLHEHLRHWMAQKRNWIIARSCALRAFSWSHSAYVAPPMVVGNESPCGEEAQTENSSSIRNSGREARLFPRLLFVLGELSALSRDSRFPSYPDYLEKDSMGK